MANCSKLEKNEILHSARENSVSPLMNSMSPLSDSTSLLSDSTSSAVCWQIFGFFLPELHLDHYLKLFCVTKFVFLYGNDYPIQLKDKLSNIEIITSLYDMLIVCNILI